MSDRNFAAITLNLVGIKDAKERDPQEPRSI